MPIFTSYSDALVFVQNSFSPDYEFGGNATAEGLASYLYSHTDDSFDLENYDAELAAYLRYVGENPSDYNLN